MSILTLPLKEKHNDLKFLHPRPFVCRFRKLFAHLEEEKNILFIMFNGSENVRK